MFLSGFLRVVSGNYFTVPSRISVAVFHGVPAVLAPGITPRGFPRTSEFLIRVIFSQRYFRDFSVVFYINSSTFLPGDFWRSSSRDFSQRIFRNFLGVPREFSPVVPP